MELTPSAPGYSGPLLRVRNVHKYKGRRHILDAVTLDISAHDIIGIFGPNGAGKTTLLHILGGLWRPSAGSLEWQGLPYSAHVLSQIGIVWDRPVLHDQWTAPDHFRYYGMLYGILDSSPKRWMRRLGLSDYEQVRVNKFSWGMKKRLSLGLALLKQPQLLLMDEPLNGLDPASANSFLAFLHSDKCQAASLIVSHDVADILPLCTRYAVLRKGRLRWAPDEIINAKEWVMHALSEQSSTATF